MLTGSMIGVLCGDQCRAFVRLAILCGRRVFGCALTRGCGSLVWRFGAAQDPFQLIIKFTRMECLLSGPARDRLLQRSAGVCRGVQHDRGRGVWREAQRGLQRRLQRGEPRVRSQLQHVRAAASQRCAPVGARPAVLSGRAGSHCRSDPRGRVAEVALLVVPRYPRPTTTT